MSNLHRDLNEANKHTAKGFVGADNGAACIRNENGVQEFEKPYGFPAAINFVDGNAAPPTVVNGDIYVLVDLGNGALNAAWTTVPSVAYGDWVKRNTVWLPRTPEFGTVCFNKADEKDYYFDGSEWLRLHTDLVTSVNGDTGAVTVIPNATHTGEVTGANVLTVDKSAITFKSLVTLDALDQLLIADGSDSGNLKRVYAADFRGDFKATGTYNAKSIIQNKPILLPAINFVDGNAAPPTAFTDDIYVLVDLGNGAVNAGWDGANYNDWVINGTGGDWYSSAPTNGAICYDKTASKNKRFNGTTWIEEAAANIYNANGTLTANRTVTMSSFSLIFSGNTTTFKGIGATSATSALIVQNSVGSEMIRVTDDARLVLGGANGSQAGLLQITGSNSVAGARIYNSSGVLGLTLRANTTTGGEVLVSDNTGVSKISLNGVGDSYFSDNVGFGIASPTAKAHVYGGAGVDAFRVENASGFICKFTSSRTFELGGGGGGQRIYVRGFGTTSSTFTAIFVNSSDQAILNLRDDRAIGMYGATPVVQATTGGASSTFAANTSGIINNTATFDGYTIGQVVYALRNLGILQ